MGRKKNMNKDIYGWRGRIGLLYPSSSNTMEPEFYAMSPKGVITCTTRIHLEEVSVDALQKMDLEIENGAKLLSESYVDSLVFGCTAGSFLSGEEYNQSIIRRMQSATGGIKSTTTATALVEAIKELGIKKIAVAAPYIDEVNLRAKKYFEEHGIEVCNLQGLQLSVDREITDRSAEENYRFAKSVNVKEADAVLILCTSMKTVSMLEDLEKDIDKPVISAILASFWHGIRLAGINEKIEGYGKLLRN